MVSNHGGRQLDGVEATIDALPAIVKGGLISEIFSLWPYLIPNLQKLVPNRVVIWHLFLWRIKTVEKTV